MAGQPHATTIAELQTQLDTFTELYNHHHRVRRDRVDTTGEITLRHNSRLHHIGIGREHARTHVLVLAAGLDIRIIDSATGELLRALTLDTTRDYQPTGKPRSQKQQNPRT